ncbi:MAG TPA: response regulator [Bacteroidia bacterium]|nr:response regulator [Bacteroidia bacterium]
MIQSEPLLTVFTVDDSEIVFKNMGIWLSENKNVTWLGHAFSLADAYKQIAEKKPQLVILDIQLKEGTSFDLLEYLGKQHPNTVVIMFTNKTTAPYRKKCEELGAKYFFDKSSEFEKIPQLLKTLLQSK